MPKAAPCRTASSAGGIATTPSRPRAGRSRPSTWWRRWPATSWSTWAGAGCCSARRSARRRPSWPTFGTRPRGRGTSASTPATRTCSWPRPPRSCSSTPRTPTGSGCTGPCPGATRCAASSCGPSPRREDADAVNRIYVRCGMVPAPADVLWANQQARHVTYLVAEDLRTGSVDRHRDRASTTPLAFDDPEGGSSLWCLAVDPASQAPGVGEALVRALAERFHDPRARAYLDLSVMHDNAPGHRPLRQARLRAGARVRGQAEERDQRAAVRGRARGPRRPEPLRPDHRRRGAAARDGRSRSSTPGPASCGCRTAGAAS